MCADNRISFLERRITDLEERLRKAEEDASRANIRLSGLGSEISGAFYLRYMEVTTLLAGLGCATVAMRRNLAAGVLIAALYLLWWWTIAQMGSERR